MCISMLSLHYYPFPLIRPQLPVDKSNLSSRGTRKLFLSGHQQTFSLVQVSKNSCVLQKNKVFSFYLFVHTRTSYISARLFQRSRRDTGTTIIYISYTRTSCKLYKPARLFQGYRDCKQSNSAREQMKQALYVDLSSKGLDCGDKLLILIYYSRNTIL